MSHTPGFWQIEVELDEDGNFIETGNIITIETDVKRRIGPGPDDFESCVEVYVVAHDIEDKANRRLICCAPEMLAALQQAHDTLRECASQETCDVLDLCTHIGNLLARAGGSDAIT